MARRIYHVFDGHEEETTPSLLPKNPLRPPLTRTVKSIAVLVGACTTISGAVLGVFPYVLRAADIATNASVSAQIAGAERRRQESDAIDARNRAADMAEMKALLREKLEALSRPRKGRP